MKITSIEARPVSLVVNPALAIVSAAGTHPESHYVVIHIHTDEGVTGIGEATLAPVWSGESQGGALHAIERILTPVLKSKDPMRVREIMAAVDRALIGNPFTKAAVEMALLDLTGKALGVPVSQLLGGAQRSPAIPLKFSIGAFAPKEAARIAQHAAEIGLKAVKVKVGLDVRSDIERVEAVRSTLGEGFQIGVDANAGWTESDATRAIVPLERLRVNAFEQPLWRGEFRGCARLRRKTSIPIMLDESIFTPQDAMEAIREECCDLISVYPGKNGGILRSMEIAQMAATAGIECIIGSNLEMDLGSAAMLQLAVSMPALCGAVNHDIIGPLYYQQHLTKQPIEYAKGCALVPQGTGLGVELER